MRALPTIIDDGMVSILKSKTGTVTIQNKPVSDSHPKPFKDAVIKVIDTVKEKLNPTPDPEPSPQNDPNYWNGVPPVNTGKKEETNKSIIAFVVGSFVLVILVILAIKFFK
jgi:hypothetical protein